MHKVIVERPRRGHASPSKKTHWRLRAKQAAEACADADGFDSGPSRAPVSRHGKWLNENLAPLERYLNRQVNRPWSKVYSEIRQVVDGRSAVRQHIWQHLFDMVETNVVMRDGRPHYISYGGLRPVRGLYVHPKTGLLRRTKPTARPRHRPPYREPDFILVSETLFFKKIGAFWFRFTMRRMTPQELEEWIGKQPAAHRPYLIPPRILLRKQQCDRKTTQKIESGEFGPIVTQPWYLRY